MSCQTNGQLEKTDPHWSVALSGQILLVYSSENVECPLTRECKQWKKIQFPFSKVSASAYESVRLWECVNTEFDWEVKMGIEKSVLNPFTPKSDQSPISPVASPEILHHTIWRTWLFIAYSDERWLHYQFSLPNPYISLEEGWENVLFELGSERAVRLRECPLTKSWLYHYY